MEAKTQVEGDTLKAALRCSLTLLGNAAAHVSVERRKCIMKHLNSDLKPVAEGPFPDRGPDLFGKSFGDRAKATANSIKAVKGVQFQKCFSWSGGPKYKPHGCRQHWGISQPNPQKSVFKQAPWCTNKPDSNPKQQAVQEATKETAKLARPHNSHPGISVPSWAALTCRHC